MDKTTQDLLIDYLHNALPAAERSALETRLRDDSDFMAELTRLRNLQQQVKGGVSAEISQARPPASMTFDAISSDVLSRRPGRSRYSRVYSSLTAFAALAILLFSVIYSLPDRPEGPIEGSAATATVSAPVEALPQFETTATPTMTPTIGSGDSSIPSRNNSSIPAPPREETPEPESFFEDGVPDIFFTRTDSKLLHVQFESAMFTTVKSTMASNYALLNVDPRTHLVF